MKEKELRALINSFLKEADTTNDKQLRDLVIKLSGDFKKIDAPGHVPGEISGRIIKIISNLNKERTR